MSTELSTLGSVIKTAYEGEADTNAYTDAEKAKLAAVEALADVTDTTNVTAAGALMDSEVTNLAAVKAFDPTAYATAAQGSTADSALQAVSDDTTPTLGGALDAGGFDITNLGDVTFKTGAAGGTLRTGTSAADKFQLQGYDVDGAAYRTVLEVDAGNDVRLQLPVVYLDLEDATDTTKIAKFDASGITTGTTRTFAFPDASGTFALSDNIEGAAIKSTGEAGGTKFLREDGDGTCSWQTVAVGTGDLKADGTVPLTANWDVGSFDITAEQFHSDIATGTAPFTVASTTVVTNLNADLLDGNEASAFAAAAHAHEGTAILSTGPVTDGYVLTADGAGGAAWEAAAGGGVDWTTAQDHDLTAATGNEVAFSFTSEVNKATSGNYTGIKLNVTETAAPGTADLLLDLQVGGTSAFTVSNSGDITLGSASVSAVRSIFIGNDVDAKIVMYAGLGHGFFGFCKADGNEVARIGRYNADDGVHIASDAFFGIGATTTASTKDVRLYRDAAAVLAQRNSTTAQTFRVYNTYTDASNYQRLSLGWSTSTALIHNEGAGTGADGSVAFNDAALATTATKGFLMIPSCAGAPTGTPADIPTGQVPIVFDSTNNQLYVYDGGWLATAALT